MGSRTLRGSLEVLFWTIVVARFTVIIALPTVAADPPLIVVAARPTGDVLLLASANATAVDLVVIAFCAVGARMVMDIATFALFRWYGPTIASRLLSTRGVRAVAALRRKTSARTLVALCVIASSTPVVAAAGIAGLRPRTFILASSTGSALVVTAYLALASRFDSSIASVATWVSTYQWWLSGLIALTIALMVIVKRRRRIGEAPEPDHPDPS